MIEESELLPLPLTAVLGEPCDQNIVASLKLERLAMKHCPTRKFPEAGATGPMLLSQCPRKNPANAAH